MTGFEVILLFEKDRGYSGRNGEFGKRGGWVSMDLNLS